MVAARGTFDSHERNPSDSITDLGPPYYPRFYGFDASRHWPQRPHADVFARPINQREILHIWPSDYITRNRISGDFTRL